MPHDDKVEPSTPSRPASRHAHFSPNVLEQPPHIVQLLRRERPAAHTRRVRLNDTDRASDRLRWEPETRAYAADRGGRGRDEGVCAEVEVEHERVGALDEHAFVLSELEMEEGERVDLVGL